ncbi:AAA family ATPase [Psychromonas sp.]|uniref:AAA family ATPase n=1 Tax=Psychromonas sp. TaxID=1884585 RepID=UPI00356953FE
MHKLNIKRRIVLTGGPGGGKTTALDLFHRELLGKIALVPEAATMIFSGGIERSLREEVICAQQIAIFNLQRHLEDVQRTTNPESLILCDRGCLDGLAYWPRSEEDFFTTMNTSLNYELRRYDAVIFFETSASSGREIKSNNPIRNESAKKALILDQRLQQIWSQHPNFNLVSHDKSFIKKIMLGIATINDVIAKI